MEKIPEYLKLIFFQFLKVGKSCSENRLVNIISVKGKILEGVMTLMGCCFFGHERWEIWSVEAKRLLF